MMTFEEFKKSCDFWGDIPRPYYGGMIRKYIDQNNFEMEFSLDLWLFENRYLCPDGEGWFGNGRGTLCDPTKWYEMYYERRKAVEGW